MLRQQVSQEFWFLPRSLLFSISFFFSILESPIKRPLRPVPSIFHSLSLRLSLVSSPLSCHSLNPGALCAFTRPWPYAASQRWAEWFIGIQEITGYWKILEL